MNQFFTEMSCFFQSTDVLKGLRPPFRENRKYESEIPFCFQNKKWKKNKPNQGTAHFLPHSLFKYACSYPAFFLLFPFGSSISIQAGRLEFPWISMNLFCEFELFFASTVQMHVIKKRQVCKIMEVLADQFPSLETWGFI